jgi:hypothetical protein
LVISGISVVGSRLSATVEWEDNNRPQQVIWFDCAAAPLAPSTEAFLVGCALPAMRDRERRVLIDDAVDPELLQSVSEAMAWLMASFRYDYPAPVLESSRTTQCPPAPRGRHAGMLSCGVDSLAMLWLNHGRYARTHPRYISIGIVINGVDTPTPLQHEQLLERAYAVSQAAEVELLPISTNLASVALWPHPTRPFIVFSPNEYGVCILAAVAHALSGYISSVSIGSAGSGPAFTFKQARGQHPLLDPLYGSSSMRVFHEDGAMTRLQKLRVVAQWDVALKNLLICSDWARTELNCGRCEKCVRTMLEFIALGKLDASPFAGRSISAEIVRSTTLTSPFMESVWLDVIPPLAAAGRNDLAQAARAVVAEFRGRRRIAAAKERAKEFDRRYLGGLAVRLNRLVRR